jgi:hypothetical protein
MTFEYKNLDIYLENQEEKLVVKAEVSSKGQIQETLAIPQELKASEAYADEIGKLLLPGKIFDHYMDMLRQARSNKNQGIKIKLHFTDQSDACKRIPWEIARINGNFIALDLHQTIVRTSDMLDPTISLAVEKLPYRVLCLTPLPNDVIRLRSAEEIEQIKAALSPMIERNLIQLETYHGSNCTFAKVADVLEQKEFHCVHFSGHADDKGLVFANEDGRSEIIDHQRLGITLRGTEVKLFFLNTNGSTEFIEALLRSGLPIVIGSDGTLSDNAAVGFATRFYTELTRTNSVEQAVCSARRRLLEFHDFQWASYKLYSRAAENQFWTGEAGYKIETFINNGQLVTEAKQLGDFSAEVFANRLQIIVQMIGQIKSTVDQAKIKNLIAETQDAIYHSDEKTATLKLSEASTHTILTIEKEDTEEKQKKNERVARWTVLGVAVGLLIIVAILGYALRDIWTATTLIPVIALPISIVVWSFIGGVAAMLQAFVGTKKGNAEHINYEWLLWRPVVGMIMGSVLYLAISAGIAVVGQVDITTINARQNFFFWTIAFLGGFSDKFAVLVFDNIVRAFSKSSDPPPVEDERKPAANPSSSAQSTSSKED